MLTAAGKDPSSFPVALATMWTFVAQDASRAQRKLADLAAMLNRPVEAIAQQVLIGPPEECAAKLRAYAAIGVQLAFIWPIAEPVAQLEAFAQDVAPLV
jgi:alkanesulfonate monooxygenase SsuD/methylene tetrahydromethanopterin reductase-like flavin-dependent oxidoreductase (luciferase family)